MTYPDALLCHTANLETSETVTTNEFGSLATPVYTEISCRFGQDKGSYPYSQSGDRLVKTPVCIVPADTIAAEGKLLVGLTAPFTKTYRIKQVKPAMLAASVSHLVLELEAVE